MSALVDTQINQAVSNGLPPEQAGPAAKAFSQVLMQQLSNGVPPSEAMAAAQQAIQAEASFPPAASPQEAAVKNLASSGQDVSRQLESLANAKTASGSDAFDKSLAVALAKGASFDDAVKTAQQAVQTADALAKADSSPMGALANGGTTGPLANTSPGFQKALSSLLAKGLPLNDAMQRAQQADSDNAAAARADASPSAALARGDFSVLEGKPVEGSFGKSLSAALARGIPMAEAMARAAEIDGAEQRGIRADARSSLAGFSNGATVLPKGNIDFDRALASAIARGEAPADALVSAQRTVTNLPRDVQTATTALASGRNIETLLNSPGNSHVFKVALSTALARGVPVEKALADARKAEDRNAFRFPLPTAAAKVAARGNIAITTQSGDALPTWLKYVPETKSFVAFNVPEGALPIKVLINAGGQRSTITISERADRK